MSERFCESCNVRLSPLSSLWAHGICHSCYEQDDQFYNDEWPECAVVCDRCNGEGTVDCRCCGDFCCCGVEDELTCPVCLGNEYITKERAEKRAAAHRELMQALWGKPASTDQLTASPDTPQPSAEAPAAPSPSIQGAAGVASVSPAGAGKGVLS